MPSGPYSFSITAMRCPCGCARMRFRSVVLPAPRKPVRTVTGSSAWSMLDRGQSKRGAKCRAKRVGPPAAVRGRYNLRPKLKTSYAQAAGSAGFKREIRETRDDRRHDADLGGR